MNKILKPLIIVCAFSFILFLHNISTAKAETCFWRGQIGASAIMSNPANWSTDSSTSCRLDMSSDLVFGAIGLPPGPYYYNRSATWDPALTTVGSVEITSLYRGVISITAPSLNIWGDYSQSNGTVNFGNARIRIIDSFITNGGSIYPGNSTVSLGCVSMVGMGGGPPVVCLESPTPNVIAGSSSNIFHKLTVDGNYELNRTLEVRNQLTVSNGAILNAGSSILILNNNGNPLTISGIFSVGSGTVIYGGNGAVTIKPITYHNLYLNGGGNYALAGTTTVNNAFSLRSFASPLQGALSLGNFVLAAPGDAFANYGLINELPLGVILHPAQSIKLTDALGAEVSSYNTSSNSVYVTVRDDDANLNGGAIETIATNASVRASTYNDMETVSLTETGASTGIFRSNAIPFSVSGNAINNNGRFEVSGNGVLTLNYTDSRDPGDTGADSANYSGAIAEYNTQEGLYSPIIGSFLNPSSQISLRNIIYSFEGNDLLVRINYQYQNLTGSRIRIKTITEAINDATGAGVARRAQWKILRPNATVNRKVILRVPRGNTYMFRIKIFNGRTSAQMDWNGFLLSL